jgi:hypothetical protein
LNLSKSLLAFKIWALIFCSEGHFWPMKLQLSQNPDVLGKIQVQSQNQQLKIYQKWLSLPCGIFFWVVLSLYDLKITKKAGKVTFSENGTWKQAILLFINFNFANNWDNIRNATSNTNEFGEVFNVEEPQDFCEETTAQPETKKVLQELRNLCIINNF